MNQQQYLAQNALGFEGDTILADKFRELIESKNITWVVEAGTFKGATTKHFATWAKTVDTIEINEQNYNDAKANLQSFPNVNMHFGNSSEVMESILSALPKRGRKPNTLFFLDAHWEAYNPLLDELACIERHGLKPYIVIHDFKVPNHPELGFDTYGSIVYEWGWIAESIEKIYGKDGYTVEYNSESTGAKRGVVFISPVK